MVLAKAFVVGFVIFTLLVVWGCAALCMDDAEREMEDEDQMKYIMRWKEEHNIKDI